MIKAEAGEELKEAVQSLSAMTPDGIAKMMRRRKVGGRPGTTGNCPLANLLNGAHSGRFIVGPKFIARQCGRSLEKIPTPPKLAQFIRAFDLSRYPDLIMPPPRVLPKRKPTKLRKFNKRGPVVNHPAVMVGRW